MRGGKKGSRRFVWSADPKIARDHWQLHQHFRRVGSRTLSKPRAFAFSRDNPNIMSDLSDQVTWPSHFGWTHPTDKVSFFCGFSGGCWQASWTVTEEHWRDFYPERVRYRIFDALPRYRINDLPVWLAPKLLWADFRYWIHKDQRRPDPQWLPNPAD